MVHQGLHLETSITCHLTPILSRATHLTEAKNFNSSFASCQVYGSEGVSTLKVRWDQECSAEFEIEFLLEPVVWRINPLTIPRIGKSNFALHLHSGQPNLRESITMFLPKKTDPVLLIKCSENISFHKAEFGILSDYDWIVNTTLMNVSRTLSPGVCDVSLSLNGRDYFDTERTVVVTGPEVCFASRKIAVVNGDSTKIWVTLDQPVSEPVSIGLELVFPETQYNLSHRFQFSSTTVYWSSGEEGPKAILLEVREGNEDAEFHAKLSNPINCDIDMQRNTLKLVTMSKEDAPEFHTHTRKVLYPGDMNSFAIDVMLTHGLSTLSSVIEYSVSSMQLNSGCKTVVESKFINESSGQIEWIPGKHIHSIFIHVFWENITFCDELEVSVILKGIEMAKIQQEVNTVARIYGTPKNICPPGTVIHYGVRGSNFSPAEYSSVISLFEINIEGIHAETSGFYETELVPAFVNTHFNYTAMIPYDMKHIKMKLIRKAINQEVFVEDESCNIDEELEWKPRSANNMEAEITMNPVIQRCSLKVINYYSVEIKWDQELDELAMPSTPVMENEARSSDFVIDFLHLSKPQYAKLRSVEIRNTTHLVCFCGPKYDSTYLQDLSKNSRYKVIDGYPRNSCHIKKHNYIDEILLGDEIFIIPQLERPEIQTTKIEVSGIFLRGFNEMDDVIKEQNPPESETEGDEMLLAAAFDGVPMTLNTSFSFDIRVTAEDTVTSNLYRFVYGNPKSAVQLYPSGSSFDIESHQSVSSLNASANSSGIWPISPSDYDWCSQCSAGSFSVGVDTLECALCPPGHYSPTAGNSECIPCPEGTFSYTWGSQICRQCMIGSAANKQGSEYCQLCPDRYMTDREGSAHCTVSIKSTDLSTSYAIIASFGVVLNGTSLEEVERLGTGVRASGIIVLKTLIRTDMADALNISVGDVAVTGVTPYGKRALLVNVDTTFKIDVDESAEPEEVDAKVALARLKGDHAVAKVQNDPDGVLRRTTKATHSHAHVKAGARIIAHRPKDDTEDHPWHANMVYALISICALFCSCTCIVCFQIRKHRVGKRLPSYHIW
eukprot:g1822.t1